MEYRVVRAFTDKNDENRSYQVNDIYEGSKAPRRISELMNPEKNRYQKIYLEKIVNEENE